MTVGANARIFQRASLNITDGLSMLQVADGAYQGASGVLSRFAELAEQAASGSLSNTQRGALNQELRELKAELMRIRDTVSFNGRSLLQGGAVTGSVSTVTTGATFSAVTSSDGRYTTYAKGSGIYQLDHMTGETRTISSFAANRFAASSRGDYVAFWGAGNTIMLYDRVNNTTSSTGLVTGSMDYIAVSEDGAKVAIIGRNAWDANGNELGELGARHLTFVDTATRTIRGDGGSNAFSSYGSLVFSNDGSRVAMYGSGNIATVFASSNPAAAIFQTTGYAATKVRFASDNSILFSSTANVGGLNGSGLANVYKYDGTSYSAVTSITSGGGVLDFFATDYGSSVTFTSADNLVGENSAGKRQLYKKYIGGSLNQLTAFTGTEAHNLVSVSGDGYTMLSQVASLRLEANDIRGELAVSLETGDGAQWGITGRIRGLDAAVRGLYYLDVSTQRLGKLSLDVIRDNVQRLGAASGELGSGLSRLSSALRTTQSKASEFLGAADRITSADIAEAVSQQLRYSLMENSQIALLGQTSRLIPQVALQLLQSASDAVPGLA